jgi:hypothetical protein
LLEDEMGDMGHSNLGLSFQECSNGIPMAFGSKILLSTSMGWKKHPEEFSKLKISMSYPLDFEGLSTGIDDLHTQWIPLGGSLDADDDQTHRIFTDLRDSRVDEIDTVRFRMTDSRR